MFSSKLSPKTQRNVSRIIPFGLIWLFSGWVFLINDLTVTGNQNQIPESAITITIPIFIFASISLFIVGTLIGTIEIILLEKKFKTFSLPAKLFSKFVIYAFVLFSIILITYPIAGAIESGRSPFHPDVLTKLVRFLSSVVFFNTALQLSVELFLSLIYATISEHLGYNVLRNFFTGKYHRPKHEHRIFMFLDMKNSTTIAEKLGHYKYFEFLQAYYDSLSDAIIQHQGEVYQYIGDEIVLTWKLGKSKHNHHWYACYFALKATLEQLNPYFKEMYGISPDFRAGAHAGEVTTGELGALKKEIVFTGDVLNISARLQALCKTYETDLVFSDVLTLGLKLDENQKKTHLGEIVLKGKSSKTSIYTIR
ncbi:MAG: adenylate/guanylate cyclase domain-containing protein [Balneolaceae bacterium]